MLIFYNDWRKNMKRFEVGKIYKLDGVPCEIVSRNISTICFVPLYRVGRKIVRGIPDFATLQPFHSTPEGIPVHDSKSEQYEWLKVLNPISKDPYEPVDFFDGYQGKEFKPVLWVW
jgi:hypothetical protein